MQMDEGLDTGDVLLKQALDIAPDDTGTSLSQRLAELGGELLLRSLRDLAQGPVERRPQASEGVSYAHKITKAEAAIDWRDDAAVIERRVRAFDPFPGASFEWQGEAVKLWRAAVCPGMQGPPGTPLPSAPGTLRIACGRDALDLLELQRPGGRRLPVAAWLLSRRR
jgi:methionyl-tRNA formyltransferase